MKFGRGAVDLFILDLYGGLFVARVFVLFKVVNREDVVVLIPIYIVDFSVDYGPVGFSFSHRGVKLVVTVLQQCCLEFLVNSTIESSLIEMKFGRGVVDLFILDLYGGVSLWLPEF
ncbi:hypothetical protein F2Q70_00040367 [Brassica cretica]|uniref:Uncharacterized protein n=1 Tax=Brassica cretica TaxID=69181 RepID=A0A8S9K736_BRACR|nr:hypothetical protein F2Q70_00040367 [Brassica cretica]